MWACIPWGFLPVVCEHRCSSCSSANRDPSLGQSWRVRCSRGALVTCCSTCEHRPWHPLRSTAFSRCKTTRQTNIRAPNSKLVCSTWPTMMMMVTRTASFLAFLTLFFSLLFCCAPTTASTNTLGISDRDLAKRKISCYQDIDNGLWGSHCRSSAINKENCALRCVSHSCYDSVYGNDHVSLTPCFPLPSFFSWVHAFCRMKG